MILRSNRGRRALHVLVGLAEYACTAECLCAMVRSRFQRSEIQIINPNSKVLAQKTHTATQTTSALDLARSRLSFLSEFACIGNGNAYTMHTSLVLLDPAIE